jgi:hypothetical protein
LDEALKRNAARLQCPKLLVDVARSLGRPRETLSIAEPAEANALWETCLANRNAALHGEMMADYRVWTKEQEKGLVDRLSELEVRLPLVRMYLYVPSSEECGAIETTSREFAASALRLLRVHGDDVVAATDDGSCGLWLDYNWHWFGTPHGGTEKPLPSREHFEQAILRGSDVYETEAFELLVWGVWEAQASVARDDEA